MSETVLDESIQLHTSQDNKKRKRELEKLKCVDKM